MPDPTQQREEWTIWICPDCSTFYPEPRDNPSRCWCSTADCERVPCEPIRAVSASRAEAAEAEVEKLKEALAWYANETDHDDCCNDYGKRARSALSGGEE